MNEAASSPESSALLDPAAWCVQHPRIAIGIGAFCLWISVSLIIRLWFIHRKEHFAKKLVWSVILLIPLFGWLAYGGCFRTLKSINTPCPREHDWGDTTITGFGGGHD